VGSSTTGSVFVGAVQQTLVEHWNGKTWSIVPSPNPNLKGEPGSSLSDVSCPSPNRCIAVGASNDNTLIEQWNGTKWTRVSSPNSGNLRILNGVSCPSTTSCTAVGTYQNSHGFDVTLIAHWAGSKWTIVHSPNPTGGFYTTLESVSCSSETSCTAVGYWAPYSNGYDAQIKTLVERWNGTKWSITHSPNRPNGKSSLHGVSCLSAIRCFAVGDYLLNHQVENTLSERYA
jgi:hypothetical protein